MSNRAERRAAERTANKAANKAAKDQSATQESSTIAQPVTAQQSLAAAATFTKFSFDQDLTTEPNQEPVHMSEPETNPAETSFDDLSSNQKQARIRTSYQKAIAANRTSAAAPTGDEPSPEEPNSASDTKSSASEAQINANRENAQKSTGAKTAEGKATISQNRRTHGLIGRFAIKGDESTEDFLTLKADVIREHQPQTCTEWRLAQSVIEHFWRMHRAIRLQDGALQDPKMLALYMRYQTTHERAYYRALKELQNLAKERAKEQIGFERQNTNQEAHEARTRLQHARAESIEIDSRCKQVMAVPIPGMETVSFKELAEACSLAITGVVYRKQSQNAAA